MFPSYVAETCVHLFSEIKEIELTLCHFIPSKIENLTVFAESKSGSIDNENESCLLIIVYSSELEL